MTTLAAWSNELLSGLRPHFDSTIKIDTHPGAMSIDAVKTYALSAPCLRLAVLSAPVDEEEFPLVRVRAAVYVVVKNGRAGLPAQQLLVLGSQLLSLFASLPLAPTDTQTPRGIEYRNLYSPELGAEGIALGSLSFNQLVQLDLPAAALPAGVLAELTTTYSAADAAVLAADDQQFPTE